MQRKVFICAGTGAVPQGRMLSQLCRQRGLDPFWEEDCVGIGELVHEKVQEALDRAWDIIVLVDETLLYPELYEICMALHRDVDVTCVFLGDRRALLSLFQEREEEGGLHHELTFPSGELFRVSQVIRHYALAIDKGNTARFAVEIGHLLDSLTDTEGQAAS